MTGDIFNQFLNKLKAKKSETEVKSYLDGLFKLQATELYTAIVMNLSDEDLKEIDEIGDDQLATEKIIEKFKLKSGLSPEEFVNKIKEVVSHGDLPS